MRIARLAIPLVGTLVLLSWASGAEAQSRSAQRRSSADEFAGVRCSRDVRSAMIGRALARGRAVQIEAAHRDIGLRNLGGSEVNDTLFLGGWEICGNEYQVLMTPSRITDVARFPAHSRRNPAVFGTCTRDGKRIRDGVLAVLDNASAPDSAELHYSSDDTTSLAAIAAWRVDERHGRFVKLASAGLRCPRGQINTADGGP